ncbi:hypothetical protein BDN71DRAFT_761584 [Pleurotus eryngii]|uniref:Uncharacterized protein n=1 Tax=Pleurotus eryngii TaxID=5323 RepID=A0A9P5ZZH3_PLEER|nr:hypothetical protein BDN71DRAFT_761584 [Pleurotus eryngii]
MVIVGKHQSTVHVRSELTYCSRLFALNFHWASCRSTQFRICPNIKRVAGDYSGGHGWHCCFTHDI